MEQLHMKMKARNCASYIPYNHDSWDNVQEKVAYIGTTFCKAENETEL